MATNAQRKANAKYLAGKKTLTIRLDYEEAEEIAEAAKQAGESVQAYFLQAVRDRLDRSFGSSGVVENTESASLTEEKPSCSISPALKRAIKKTIQDAVQNFSEKEYDKLRYELDKLIYETFSDESRKPKKKSKTTTSVQEETTEHLGPLSVPFLFYTD